MDSDTFGLSNHFDMGKFNANLIKVQVFVPFVFTMIFISCGGDKSGKPADKTSAAERRENKYYDGKGVGPVQELALNAEVDEKMANAGEIVFVAKCTSCHILSDEKAIGPGLADVTKRRRPEWIMNMMLNPMEMTQKDSMAKELLSIYYSQMLDNNLTVEEARSVLEFLRKH